MKALVQVLLVPDSVGLAVVFVNPEPVVVSAFEALFVSRFQLKPQKPPGLEKEIRHPQQDLRSNKKA